MSPGERAAGHEEGREGDRMRHRARARAVAVEEGGARLGRLHGPEELPPAPRVRAPGSGSWPACRAPSRLAYYRPALYRPCKVGPPRAGAGRRPARPRAEGRYRVFADLERHCGDFPGATWHSADGPCRRDGLVLERLPRHGPASRRAEGHDGDPRAGRGRGGRHAQHRRHLAHPRPPQARAGRPPRQARGPPLHVRLRRERGGDQHAGAAPLRAASSSRTRRTTPR